jgi:predicted secreted hydrolase
VAAGLVAALLSTACAGPDAGSAGAPSGLTLAEAMAPGEAEGFLRAETPIEIRLPEDHGPHPGFQTEWWYVVGHLDAAERRFGYQVTFFRSGLQPPATDEEARDRSLWSANDVFMAHFALTDVESGAFHARERFSRAALELAGARAEPFAVWLEDWRLEGAGPSPGLPFRLRAEADSESLSFAVDLTLEEGKPAVLQGDRGLSRKGETPGNASYYYSLTRLPTRGVVRLGDQEFAVTGESWMDREWSTSALEPGQVGWDWFALQLADGRELMVYRMRREGDRTDRNSSGVIVEANGSYRSLAVDEFEIEVQDRWRSPGTGALYPSAWRVTSVAAEIDLFVQPAIAGQEHSGSVVYWEGAVSVEGRSRGKSTEGRGYVELTGYVSAGSGQEQDEGARSDTTR